MLLVTAICGMDLVTSECVHNSREEIIEVDNGPWHQRLNCFKVCGDISSIENWCVGNLYTPHTCRCGPPANDSYQHGALLELFQPVRASGCNQCWYAPFTGGPHQHVWGVYYILPVASNKELGHIRTHDKPWDITSEPLSICWKFCSSSSNNNNNNNNSRYILVLSPSLTLVVDSGDWVPLSLEESLSITTGRCDLAIATHARKMHKKISIWLSIGVF